MRLSILLLAAVVLVGCRTRPPVNNYPSSPQSFGVQIDKGLAKDLFVAGTNTDRSGDLVRMQATLRNQTKKQLPFEYRIQWFDANGMLIDSPASTWTIRHPYGGETIFLQSTAPSPAAANWTLKLKRRL